MKLDKSEVRGKDKFFLALENFFQMMVDQRVIVLVVFAVLLLGGGAYAVYDLVKEQKEEKLQQQYYSIEREYLEKKRQFEEALRAEKQPAKKEKDKSAKSEEPEKKEAPTAKATGDLEKDFGNEVKNFSQLIEISPQSKAAAMAALFSAEIYSEYKQPDQALELLKKVNPQNKTQDLLQALTVHLKANLYLEKNQCQEALPLWQKILDSKKITYLQNETKLKMALCYEKLNDLAKSQQLLIELSQKTENQSDMAISKEAEKYLRLIKRL